IDFSVFESLRDMKGMINREVRRKGLEDNIKLGAGGIREVEFIVQAFQLIRGGREPELQLRELLHVLGELEKLELLPERVVAELRAAYLFLRDTEHAIQGLADQQTQLLPKDPIGQARVASIMGFPEWAPFSAVLDGHRARVSGHFADIVAGDDAQESAQEHLAEWQAIWQGDAEDTALGWLGAQGYEAPAQALEQIARLRESRAVQIMQAQGRQRLDQFMPILLSAVAAAECPSRTLERVLGLVEAVLRRTAYLVLLIENPGALAQLVNLCSASPWIAEQLAETPMLLDELLNAHSLYKPPLKSELQSDLRQQLLRIPEDDLEEQMECLRHFKRAHVLRVAASELRGTLPLMKVSDYLTWIAEAVLDQVVELAWNALVRKHGRPTRADGSPCDKDFAVIGYGKLGGIELGYTSDLDVVFIHGADVSLSTDGERAIDNGVFFARLGQRIVHILSTQMASGQLYEVDMRLRPSGNSGLLVSSLAAFERYQRQEAWTWEHQALVRARWVAGSAQPGEDFELLRRALMALPRERSKLRRDVVEMREKMRESLGTKPGADGIYAQFHIKHDAGGIVDIEFLVQYLLLAHTQTWPELARWSDNIRQLEALGEQGVLETPVVERLREIYIAMRSTIHRRALQKLSSRVEADAFPEERAFVKAQWQQIMLAEET
ncbi:MAG: bifunctional [glutamate--ammonia ligase]-adenylyl-L-tyrosine phosphorylase/[glutamate--ammonia-ligase] adenylyltransferase, partial [Gammaproteobacteria bacterium]|nr:bifunctional [glutamate--ammonia ligase]-adenylyl-L-tyrosine phosphorylase/[glutamate--ammonia-ligase] adenylyltransferase [Gammaproteobacteria bacterium]